MITYLVVLMILLEVVLFVASPLIVIGLIIWLITKAFRERR